jgi:hypothetical protein
LVGLGVGVTVGGGAWVAVGTVGTGVDVANVSSNLSRLRAASVASAAVSGRQARYWA